MIGILGALWGLAGVSLLLGSAVYRLTLVSAEAFSHELEWYHWMALVLNVLFMAYSEGYRGFQQGFSPRVAARARYLKDHPRISHALLAPLFCMGYFHATGKRKVVSIALTVGIVILIVMVRLLPQPWRGIVDVGVVFGLTWGLISLFVFIPGAFGSGRFPYSPEVPDGPDSRGERNGAR